MGYWARDNGSRATSWKGKLDLDILKDEYGCAIFDAKEVREGIYELRVSDDFGCDVFDEALFAKKLDELTPALKPDSYFQLRVEEDYCGHAFVRFHLLTDGTWVKHTPDFSWDPHSKHNRLEIYRG